MNKPSRPKRLPINPSFEHLRKQAKQRAKQDPALKLAEAQHRIAKEYGCKNWAALVSLVEAANRGKLSAQAVTGNLTPDERQSILDAFLDAAVPRPESDHKSGALAPAARLLAAHPWLEAESIFTAAALGREAAIRRFIEPDAALATRRGGLRGWSPLLYLCFSRFLRDRRKTEGTFAKCAKLLLAHGADANDFFPAPNDSKYRETVLYGAAGVANSAAVTRLLLGAGAGVDDTVDSETLYHASEFEDNAALKLVLKAKPDPKMVSYCLCHKMDMEDPDGVRLFLEHGADPNYLLHGGLLKGYRPLHFAIFRHRSAEVFRILLEAGANPELPSSHGITAYLLASRAGRSDVVKLFREFGAGEALSAKDRWLSALSSGDGAAARKIEREHPGIAATLEEPDHHLLVDAAEAGNLAAIRLMLDQGFPIDVRSPTYGGWNGTALDNAAWFGHPKLAAFLLERGADPRVKHGYGGDALGAAIHGASHARHHHGIATVETIARHYRPAELEGYIKYAESEPNEEVVQALRKIAGT